MDSAENETNRSDDWGSTDSVPGRGRLLGYSSLVPAIGISFWGGGVGNQRPRGEAVRHSLPKDFQLRDKAKKEAVIKVEEDGK